MKQEFVVDYNVNNNLDDIQMIINIQYDFINGDADEILINFTDATFINAAAIVIGLSTLNWTN